VARAGSRITFIGSRPSRTRLRFRRDPRWLPCRVLAPASGSPGIAQPCCLTVWLRCRRIDGTDDGLTTGIDMNMLDGDLLLGAMSAVTWRCPYRTSQGSRGHAQRSPADPPGPRGHRACADALRRFAIEPNPAGCPEQCLSRAASLSLVRRLRAARRRCSSRSHARYRPEPPRRALYSAPCALAVPAVRSVPLKNRYEFLETRAPRRSNERALPQSEQG
jgi:hypothetical protein